MKTIRSEPLATVTRLHLKSINFVTFEFFLTKRRLSVSNLVKRVMFAQSTQQNKTLKVVSVEISQQILNHPHDFILSSSHWSKCGERVIKPLSFDDNH